MNAPLLNIYNYGREIYLFLRNKEGRQIIERKTDFFPYYYELGQGGYYSYKNEPLQKIVCSEPKEIVKRRTNKSYEADLQLTKRYLIDRIDTIEKTVIKYALIDIEIRCPELPDVKKAKYPINCISVYNSETKKIITFFLPNYTSEYEMLTEFTEYLKTEAFDLHCGWNYTGFDFQYLCNRYPDFAQKVSSIGKDRYGEEDVRYPAGVSIIDLLQWFKKITLNRERSYALDYIAQKYFKEPEWGKTNFNEDSQDVKLKNINDVNRMLKLEERFKLINYFDEIRRMAKVEWEDLLLNSRMIDSLLLQEGKKQKKVLPSKIRDEELEKDEYEGAYRIALGTGLFKGLGKYDLSSAYPSVIIDFCLDSANIDENGEKGISIEDSYFIQNKTALLPTIVKKLIDLKTQIKKQLEVTELNTSDYKDLKVKYDAVKGLVNSGYGVFGNRFFRLYDKRVASATTFLVRDLLHYVQDHLKEKGYEIVYIDTDSLFVQSTVNLTDLMNNLVKQWAKEKYNNTTNIVFEKEGDFNKILILSKCRYIGELNKGKKGIEIETKGVEIKRNDSSEFTKEFQKELFNKIMNEEPKEVIINWIKEQTNLIKTVPISKIAFPCKLSNKEYEKNTPVFLKALNNTPQLKKKPGDLFYYIYVKDNCEVMAFDDETKDHIKNVDYERMTERNVLNKAQVVFEAMKFDCFELVNAIKGQKGLGL